MMPPKTLHQLHRADACGWSTRFLALTLDVVIGSHALIPKPISCEQERRTEC